jgi:hypothetical protein
VEPWWALVIAVFEGIVVYIGLVRLGDPSVGIVPVMLFGGLGAIAWITSANLQRALAAAEHSTDALKIANQSLEAGQVLLEARTREVERRARYLEATSEVARDVASELALQDLLERIVRLVGLRFGFYMPPSFCWTTAENGRCCRPLPAWAGSGCWRGGIKCAWAAPVVWDRLRNRDNLRFPQM